MTPEQLKHLQSASDELVNLPAHQPCEIELRRNPLNELMIQKCLAIGEFRKMSHYQLFNIRGDISVDTVLGWADANWLSGSDRTAVESILANVSREPYERIYEVVAFMREVGDRPEYLEAFRSRLIYCSGIGYLTIEEAVQARELWRSNNGALRPVLAYLDELAKRTDKELESVIRVAVNLMQSHFEIHFDFPTKITFILNPLDETGGIKQPTAEFSLANTINLPSRPMRYEEGKYGPAFIVGNVDHYPTLLFHEIAHIISLNHLISAVPALIQVLSKQNEVRQLLDPETQSGKMLEESLWNKRESLGWSMQMPEERTGCTLEELERHEQRVQDEIHTLDRLVSTAEELILPYLELFSDLSAVSLTGRAGCILEVLPEGREGKRDYGRSYKPQGWNESDPHDVLVPAGCFIFENLLGNGTMRDINTLHRLLDDLGDEINRQMKSQDRAMQKSPEELNIELIASLLQSPIYPTSQV
jgi:hypothetical protein